jgi:hypothetical protein
VTICPLCADYPCQRLEILHHYLLLLPDGYRLQKVGLEKWASEQEARAAAGFAYADIRFPD